MALTYTFIYLDKHGLSGIMSKKHTLKVVASITASLLLLSLANTPLSAQTNDDVNLQKIARELGAIRYVRQKVIPQQQPRAQRQPVQQRVAPARKIVKHDPYAAKRQETLRQNLARRKALQQRLAQQKRQKYSQAHQQKPQQQQAGQRNVWNRIYQGFRIRDYNYKPLVQRFTREFSRSPVRIQRLAERSSDYLYMVVNELNRRRMPTELALLPFVESAYRNNAYSHAGAAGMWQFIPATGRRFGLHQTRSYDARLDPYKATHAALSYLQRLNREFRGDWLKSLAAYNVGEYRVHREVAKNKRMGRKTDYWSLDLPRETKQYVPRLLAFKQILQHPRKYGVHLRGVPNAPALQKIYVNKAVDLRKAAAHAGLPPQQLLSLNSGYLHGITTPRFSNTIILPRRHAGRLNQIIQRLPAAADVHNKYARGRYSRKAKRGRVAYHKVRRGDSLYRIARRYGTSVKSIKRLNRIRGNNIRPGSRLKVASSRSSRSRSSSSKRRSYVYHKVRLGDSLYGIARKFGTTVKHIKKLNKINGNKIWPGKRLRIAQNGSSKTNA